MSRLSAGPAAVNVQQDIPVLVRELHTTDDYRACVELQRETWGEAFEDYVPASLLKVGQLVGGVIVGAFTPEGRLVGFVFGLTGVRDGRLTHWSHMLAVHADFRNHGLGRRLKEYQRKQLQGVGVESIHWTFDPLFTRNAHLNLNRLGAEIREYVPDMYGDTGSPLHAFGTDRFVVAWPVSPAEMGRVEPPVASWRKAPLASADFGTNGGDAQLLRIEVPRDVESLSVVEACRWREITRTAFVLLLGNGYHVTGFYTDERNRCFYVLSRAKPGSFR